MVGHKFVDHGSVGLEIKTKGESIMLGFGSFLLIGDVSKRVGNILG